MMWYDDGWGGWLVTTVFTVLFWALVIAGVVALIYYVTRIRHNQRGGGDGQGGLRAEDLLAERFARGEIDEEEFRRRLTLLREHR